MCYLREDVSFGECDICGKCGVAYVEECVVDMAVEYATMAAQSLDLGAFARNRISGSCELSRVVIFALDG